MKTPRVKPRHLTTNHLFRQRISPTGPLQATTNPATIRPESNRSHLTSAVAMTWISNGIDRHCFVIQTSDQEERHRDRSSKFSARRTHLPRQRCLGIRRHTEVQNSQTMSKPNNVKKSVYRGPHPLPSSRDRMNNTVATRTNRVKSLENEQFRGRRTTGTAKQSKTRRHVPIVRGNLSQTTLWSRGHDSHSSPERRPVLRKGRLTGNALQLE